MTAALPPHVELERVVAGLVAHLRAEWPTVLADERWAEASDSLARLAAPGALPALARDLGPAQCRRLAELLMSRWESIGEVELPPAAAIVPDGEGELTLVVAGLDEGWSATWAGPVEGLDPTGARVRLVEADPAAVTARVFGRTAAGRTILVANGPGAPDAGD